MSSPEDDALRRDFTVNALYYNIKKVDPLLSPLEFERPGAPMAEKVE
jgi:hypothetical protein